ncbi:hypothetical protein [Hoeflea sp.]|uniref:hypothetical protein n=1 Tax=Hoeflea sp. TaxID=1940281 RepID=UPI003A93E006
MGEALDLNDTPIFDYRHELPKIIDPANDWTPPRTKPKPRGNAIEDGPSLEWRLASQAARIGSNKYSGQAANDNVDWPLAKLLRTEGNAYHLSLAESYRELSDMAHLPELKGQALDDLYLLRDQDDNGRDKGVKQVEGRKANLAIAPRQNAKPVPKAWNGDWPLLAAIDARRDLAYLRAKLGFVPKILAAFEWSVLDGLTLEEIGKLLGAGVKGAKGEARARIFDGFEIVDRYWRGVMAA